MGVFLCCCTLCKPRYKRLVDGIYPRSLTEDLVNSNMQKLTFYSISHPEKLNRIGQYLVQRLSRDLYRQRDIQVKIAVNAMDQLLKSCHGSPSLNQFIESYLKMVQTLLETNDSKMEILATDLFVSFSSIEEDIPSYYRQYDFFISKFSIMCYFQNDVLRVNGLRGLRGVIWKSVHGASPVNIWERQHIDKIIPSILSNLENEYTNFDETWLNPSSPFYKNVSYPKKNNCFQINNTLYVEPNLALHCLRDLLGNASFDSLRYILESVMKYINQNNQWHAPAIFATKTFKAILCSIPIQNSSFIIQELINYLVEVPTLNLTKRIGIITVISNIIDLATSSIGPLLLGIFNFLLKLLIASLACTNLAQCIDAEGEKEFQTILINVIRDFTLALPDYQQNEIKMFIKSGFSELYVIIFPNEIKILSVYQASSSSTPSCIKTNGSSNLVFGDSSINIPSPGEISVFDEEEEDDKTLSDTLSFDWTSYESSDESLKNNSMTLATLRQEIRSPIDFNEETLKNEKRNREILTKYRENSEEIASSKESGTHDLANTIAKVTKQNREWNNDHGYGRTVAMKNIFDCRFKFPSSFVTL